MTGKPKLKLVENNTADGAPVSALKRSVRHAVGQHKAKAREKLLDLRLGADLPRVSVLASLSRYDRDAVIEHHRSKKLSWLAEYKIEGNERMIPVVQKSLRHIDEIAEAFAEIDREWWLAG